MHKIIFINKPRSVSDAHLKPTLIDTLASNKDIPISISIGKICYKQQL